MSSNESKPIDVRVIPRKSTKKTPARDESAESRARGGGIKSEAVDELSQCFKGDVLLDLHELGVSAFNANELERNVMAQADMVLEMQRCDHETKRTNLQLQRSRRDLKELETKISTEMARNGESERVASLRKQCKPVVDDIDDMKQQLLTLADTKAELFRLQSGGRAENIPKQKNSSEASRPLRPVLPDTKAPKEDYAVSHGDVTPFGHERDWEKNLKRVSNPQSQSERRTRKKRKLQKILGLQVNKSEKKTRKSCRRRRRAKGMVDDADAHAFAERLGRLYQNKPAIDNAFCDDDNDDDDDDDDDVNDERDSDPEIQEDDAEQISDGERSVSTEPVAIDMVDVGAAEDVVEEEQEQEDVDFGGGFLMPASIYDRLFKYQRTGVKWLWELHCQNVGGIVGDAMGLGKTVMMVSFLRGLAHSPSVRAGATLVLCPASVLGQWLREFRFWWPECRTMLLHDSGNHAASNEKVVDIAIRGGEGHTVITTYESLRRYRELLLTRQWGYAVLDEGHRIRNPDATITLLCKQLLTLHRIILSGSPIQNHLKELWSLFDFIFPGKLGTLPVFEEEFCVPISAGGYVHATRAQVQTAFRCAALLKSMITPHILRRLKKDVLEQLPQKTEQVLFCRLSPQQRVAYQRVLESPEVTGVIEGKLRAFKAISLLRKICNHPDLLYVHSAPEDRPLDYGATDKSGKLKVVERVLSMWHSQKHRTLLFCQTRQSLDILEQLVQHQNYEYRRVDGSTPVRSRMAIFDDFNQHDQVFVLLLTTRAGGFGLNLVGANRVLIFDPDWNPATDEQAQDRAYRIGQTRDVSVFRLISRGTIEEKVYHRQIFKQMLTNKVLNDPSQKRIFSSSDIRDLFTFNDDEESETSQIFQSSDADITAGDIMPVSYGRERAVVDATTDAETEPSADADADESTSTDEREVLRRLFDNEDLSSVFEHDKIFTDAKSTKSKESVEKAARARADKALQSLRNSRKLMQDCSIGLPTWTGRSGAAGLPNAPATRRFGNVVRWLSSSNTAGKIQDAVEESTKKHRKHQDDAASALSSASPVGLSQIGGASTVGPLSSASLLQSMKQRKAAKEDEPLVDARTRQLLEDIQKQLRKAGDRGIESSLLVDQFRSRLKTDDDQYVFRHMLRHSATLFRPDSKQKRWKLKPQFL